MSVGLLGLLIVHEAAFDVLRTTWPSVTTTRCSSLPTSPLKIGEQYLSVSVPSDLEIVILHSEGAPWQCRQCHRWACDWKYDARYTSLRSDQLAARAFTARGGDLFVRQEVREALDTLGFGEHSWKPIPIREEPLPQNRIPGLNCPPLPTELQGEHRGGILRAEHFYYDGLRRIQEVVGHPIKSLEGLTESEIYELLLLAWAEFGVGEMPDIKSVSTTLEEAHTSVPQPPRAWHNPGFHRFLARLTRARDQPILTP